MEDYCNSRNVYDELGVRPDRVKLNCDQLLELLESGDLSDIEGLCDDEQDELNDFITQGDRNVSVNEPVAGPSTRPDSVPNSDDSIVENDSNDYVSSCATAKEFQTEYFKQENLTSKKQIKWKHAAFSPPVLQPFMCEDNIVDNMLELPTPTEIFVEYFDSDIIDKMVYFTNLYAVQNCVTNFQPTNFNEIKTFIGVHILMGNLNYPRVRMYWEPRFRIPLIADYINLNRFYKLRTNFHVVDTSIKDQHSNDRFWKVRPIFDCIKKRCSKLPIEVNLSVDEQMVPFKGKLNVKQFIHNKPTKWGVKVFVLCGESGLMYDFIIYQGSTTELKTEYSSFGLGSGIVMQLSERIEAPYCRLFFDNFFSSYNLFQWLKNRNIYGAGTVRVDRFSKPPFRLDAELKKKETRGYSEEVVGRDDIVITKWYNNSFVTLGSNFVGIGQEDMCLRWDKMNHKHINVKRPEVVKLYNKSMGGVDKYDFLIAIYRTFIRSKKWTLRMFTHSIDMAVMNSWIEYRKQAAVLGINENKIFDLIHFRQYVAEALIITNSSVTKKEAAQVKKLVQVYIQKELPQFNNTRRQI